MVQVVASDDIVDGIDDSDFSAPQPGFSGRTSFKSPGLIELTEWKFRQSCRECPLAMVVHKYLDVDLEGL